MIFVTGGTGLLGSQLLVDLAKKHQKITATYRNAAKISIVEKLFSFYFPDNAKEYFNRIKWVQCDLQDIPLLEIVMKNHTEIYHCAGFVSFDRRDFNKLIQVNRIGTTNIVNCALHHKVEKFCYVSSTSAVGKKDIPSETEITEEGKWVKTEETSAYAISKYNGEKEVCRGIHEGLNAVIVNPGMILGIGDWSTSSIAIFGLIKKGMPFYTPGKYSYVDARDVSEIMIRLMEGNKFGERYICVSEHLTFQELFSEIALRLNKKPPKLLLPKTLMKLVYYLSSIGNGFLFRRSRLTLSTVQSAYETSIYSSQKIKEELAYSFFSIEETIQHVIDGGDVR